MSKSKKSKALKYGAVGAGLGAAGLGGMYAATGQIPGYQSMVKLRTMTKNQMIAGIKKLTELVRRIKGK